MSFGLQYSRPKRRPPSPPRGEGWGEERPDIPPFLEDAGLKPAFHKLKLFSAQAMSMGAVIRLTTVVASTHCTAVGAWPP